LFFEKKNCLTGKYCRFFFLRLAFPFKANCFMNNNIFAGLFLILLLSAAVAFRFNPSQNTMIPVPSDTVAPLVVRAKDHLGKSIVSTTGVISFTTGLDNDFYPADSSGQVFHFYMETKLDKFENGKTRRIPVNISIVIDRSSSMQGVKLGYAKKAAKNIIDRLTPEDLVSIVAYDSDVDTIQSPLPVIDKQKIKAKIDAIGPRASTNLWGGTEQGYRFVQRNFRPGFVNRVLLISDGRANAGLTDSVLIRMKVQQYKDKEGISLSTFGVGLDYNETLMTDMAETGAGNYYFIDAPDRMAAIFNNELIGLFNVALQNAEWKIRLPKRVAIVKGYPLNYQQEGDVVTIRLRDLSSAEAKAMLFSFAIANRKNEVLKFTSTFSYTDVTDGQQKMISHENILQPAKSREDYLTHFNRQVVEQTILYTANEALETAMNLMDRGSYQEAAKYLSNNKEYLKRNFVYVSSDPALVKLDSINNNYSIQYRQAEGVSKDSVKKVQKSNKAVNYRIRNKKQY
jgi:Ca-activated chloride channel homolog